MKPPQDQMGKNLRTCRNRQTKIQSDSRSDMEVDWSQLAKTSTKNHTVDLAVESPGQESR
ncbi:hypothetical protein DPMN_174311 [Dreissena polymorpha]|uniref:Uncharacterized protein n=1 Tax=Dreissena polymorpha TaxID=45954 RepID=A0A9D4E561_DREPO|nr:hypothetical protein DPMN_174311 [Dreissena polymorpha]